MEGIRTTIPGGGGVHPHAQTVPRPTITLFFVRAQRLIGFSVPFFSLGIVSARCTIDGEVIMCVQVLVLAPVGT